MQLSPGSTAPSRGRGIRIVVGLVALAIVVAGGVFYARAPGGVAKDGKKDAVVPLEFLPAEVARPLLAKMPLVVEFSGALVAPRTAIVRAKAAGTLLSLAVAEGSRVKAGEAIGQIDLADLQARAADRSALVESAQASLLEAQRQHNANVGLAAQNFISTTALQTSQARLDAAKAQMKSAEAQLSTTRIGIRDAALTSPIAGIVGKRHVVPGERVSAEQPIVTVIDLSTLELAGMVGTHEVSLLRAGQPVNVRVEGEDRPVAGRIDRISPTAEVGTRAIGVVVVLDNKGERFRAGQYAQARVELGDTAERLTVPATAVGQASGQDYVWTLDKGALVRRIIITGRRDPAAGRIEVSKGLPADAQVLAARFDNLKEGAPAKVVAQRSAAASATAASATAASSAASASQS